MTRLFKHLSLNKAACEGLREAIRPFAIITIHQEEVKFCTRLYLTLYSLEADPDLEYVDFIVDVDEIMIINNYVSLEDGDWAKDVLHQTRQVLYELTTGHEAVRLASSKYAESLFEGVTLDPDLESPPEQPEDSEGPEAMREESKE